MTARSPRLLCLLATIALPLSAQTVTTLLNDTFSDADRTNQSLPSSSQWLVSSGSANLTVTDGALNQAVTGATGLTYFTAAGSPVSLAVNESLKLSFNVSFATTGNSAAGFRVGLFESGTRISADGFNNNNAAFTDAYAGYFGGLNTAATSNNILRFYERGTSPNLIGASIGTSGYAQFGSGGGAFKTLVAGSVYVGELTLLRTGESAMQVTLTYTGIFTGDSVSSTQTATVFDNADITTAFDTLAFYNTSGSAYALDNITIDYSSVPEPASAALLLGGAALGLGLARRRRRAA